MSKALDPEIKSMRAIARALKPLIAERYDKRTCERILEYFVAREANVSWVNTPIPIDAPARGEEE